MISKQTSTVRKAAHRFRKELGLSAPMALRVSRKFNDLASHVDWATPLPERPIGDFIWPDFIWKYGPHVTVVFQDVELQKDGMPVIPAMGRLMKAIKAQTTTFYVKYSKGRWRIVGSIIMSPEKTKNSALLASFVRYCEKHPREGFWPALRSWCGAAHIFAGQTREEAKDTAFWLDRRGKRWWDVHID